MKNYIVVSLAAKIESLSRRDWLLFYCRMLTLRVGEEYFLPPSKMRFLYSTNLNLER